MPGAVWSEGECLARLGTAWHGSSPWCRCLLSLLLTLISFRAPWVTPGSRYVPASLLTLRHQGHGHGGSWQQQGDLQGDGEGRDGAGEGDRGWSVVLGEIGQSLGAHRRALHPVPFCRDLLEKPAPTGWTGSR